MKLSKKQKMRQIIYLGFIFLFSSLLRQLNAQPAIKLDPEFMSLSPVGLDPNTNIMERTIFVSNTGTDILTIDVAGSTCGCVSSVITDKKIASNKTGTIKLEIDFEKTVLSAKEQTQRIVFSTNDPNRPYVNFDIIFVGKRERQDVSFGPTEIDKILSKEQLHSPIESSEQIFILDLWQKRLEITDIKSSSNLVTSYYDITYHCYKGSTTHVFRINTFLNPTENTEVFNEWVKVSTNHPDFANIIVPITYHVKSSIRLAPKILIFDETTEQRSTKTLRIKSLDKNSPLEIANIKTHEPWISTSQFQIDPNTIDLKVSIANDMKNRETSQTIKSEILIQIEKPEKIDHKVEVLILNR